MLNENDIEKAECIIRLWDSFLSNVNDKTPVPVPSRFMRKFICRLRLNEVSRQ